MKKYISKFHYLTQDLTHSTHAEQVEIACAAGCNWIQYRCLSKSDEDMISELHEIAAICDDWGATLIITNHYHLLESVDAQGAHIEDMEANFAAIREYISDEKTLGASANTFEQIQRIAASKAVDYAGLGPFSQTTTKPNNYPLLGMEGYKTIVEQCTAQAIDLLLIAVGGIEIENITALMSTGIFGIAVSGAINKSEAPADQVRTIYRTVNA